MKPLKTGFQRWSRRRRVVNARLAGMVAHEKGVAHEWDSDAARKAGRKGGLTKARNRRRREVEAKWPNK